MSNRRYSVIADVINSVLITYDPIEASNWNMPECETAVDFVSTYCGDLYTVKAFKTIEIATCDTQLQALQIYKLYKLSPHIINFHIVNTTGMFEVDIQYVLNKELAYELNKGLADAL